MVLKAELCRFSGQKIYPGKGIRFICPDPQVFLFANSKCKRYFHNRLKPAKLTWTAMYRKQHKKIPNDGLLVRLLGRILSSYHSRALQWRHLKVGFPKSHTFSATVGLTLFSILYLLCLATAFSLTLVSESVATVSESVARDCLFFLLLSSASFLRFLEVAASVLGSSVIISLDHSKYK